MPQLTDTSALLSAQEIEEAYERIKGAVVKTPLLHSLSLSEKYGAEVYLKREDLQNVRSYKIRGAYNSMLGLSSEQKDLGVVCASAGNHAQGFALSCRLLEVKGAIYMPSTTPQQKIKQVKFFGKDWVEVVLKGDTYDDAYEHAMSEVEMMGKTFIPPFDSRRTMAGQGTVGLEILQDSPVSFDFAMVPIGGGGLCAGAGSYLKQKSPQTKVIGIEPSGAPAMKRSLEKGEVVALKEIDKFVDGAAVKRVGDLTFQVCKEVIDEMVLVPEGRICSHILSLYNEEAMVVEPAGAMAIAALDYYKDHIKGKKVVCIVSGGNNDIARTNEIKERSLLFEGLKHYFIIRFPQRAGALREFLDYVLGPNDDITHFEYTKKNSKENAPALVGVEVPKREDYQALLGRMDKLGFPYQLVNENQDLFQFIV